MPAQDEESLAALVPFDDYVRRDYPDCVTEWVAGRVIVHEPISNDHNALTVFLPCTVGLLVKEHAVGSVYHAPFVMKTGPSLPARSPDLMIVRAENVARHCRDTHLEGPADLVIEVIDPESRTRDRIEKFAEYEQGGVGEYWLIDHESHNAEFYRRGTDRRLHIAPIAPDGRY